MEKLSITLSFAIGHQNQECASSTFHTIDHLDQYDFLKLSLIRGGRTYRDSTGWGIERHNVTGNHILMPLSTELDLSPDNVQ